MLFLPVVEHVFTILSLRTRHYTNVILSFGDGRMSLIVDGKGGKVKPNHDLFIVNFCNYCTKVKVGIKTYTYNRYH